MSSSETHMPRAQAFWSAGESRLRAFTTATGRPGRRFFGVRTSPAGAGEADTVVVGVPGGAGAGEPEGDVSIVRREGGNDEDAFYPETVGVLGDLEEGRRVEGLGAFFTVLEEPAADVGALADVNE